MNVEFFRRETAKKNIGLTAMPTPNNPVTIAKGLEAIDFIGMILDIDAAYVVVTIAQVSDGVILFKAGQDAYTYNPSTGELSMVTT